MSRAVEGSVYSFDLDPQPVDRHLGPLLVLAKFYVHSPRVLTHDSRVEGLSVDAEFERGRDAEHGIDCQTSTRL